MAAVIRTGIRSGHFRSTIYRFDNFSREEQVTHTYPWYQYGTSRLWIQPQAGIAGTVHNISDAAFQGSSVLSGVVSQRFRLSGGLSSGTTVTAQVGLLQRLTAAIAGSTVTAARVGLRFLVNAAITGASVISASVQVDSHEAEETLPGAFRGSRNRERDADH